MYTEFWLVWNLENKMPRYKHANRQAAETEAMRLAAQHPGEKFYIVQALGFYQAGEVTFTELREDVPF